MPFVRLAVLPLFVTALFMIAFGGVRLDAATIKVACVGDSITYGAGSSDPATKSYPTLLGGLLGAGYTVGNFGRSGATMLKHGDLPYWSTVEFTNSDAFAPDIVVIMLGSNDSKTGTSGSPNNWQFKNEFVGDYKDLIDHYRALPSHPLVFCCIVCPVYGAGAFGITSPVVQNEVIPRIIQAANAKSAPLIDVNTAMSGAPLNFPDTVHPNDAGYVVLAATVFGPVHPPVAASGLSASTISAHRINLAWTGNSDNETGFAIERKTGAAGSYAVVATTAANAVAYSDGTAAAATDYVYRVRAVNASGTATATNEASATTPAAPPADSAHHCGHGGVIGALISLLAGVAGLCLSLQRRRP